MCPLCPRCAETDAPCANKFGNNFEPWGGIAGMTAANGCVIEYQHNNNPHAHGNAHQVSAYQHKTLEDIKVLIESDLLDPNTIFEYQTALHREDHYDHEQHSEAVAALEKAWRSNNSGAEHDALCQYPDLVLQDHSRNLWNGTMNLPEAVTDAVKYSTEYKKEAQFVMSRCNHHIHLPDPKTGVRIPLPGCRSKKARNKCKAQFPFIKKLTKNPKVICRGNARKYGLRPSGSRNALGSLLTNRRCMWFSGCAPAMALIFRCNTHTAPNYRVPPTARTHDPDCTHNCLDKKTSRLLTAIAYRAQRNTTGYYTGYMQKRQPVGAFELKQAALNLKFLEDKLQSKSHAAQFHHAANRMLSDLEFRGHVRPITEEFNLAGNFHQHDVCNAEFYRTYRNVSFYGAGLLRRLRSLKDALRNNDTKTLLLRRPFPHQRPGNKFRVSFDDAYGYRGKSPSLYYLSPWEFTALWQLEYLKPPSSYGSNAKTAWTEEGWKYYEETKGNTKAPAPKPGEHYIVVACMDPFKYISYQDSNETALLRHSVVMVRNKIPYVPQPDGTPLPTTHLSEEERCRIFSVYLRPWVLNTEDASPHVPFLADIDILVSDALAATCFDRKKRLRAKVLHYPRVNSSGEAFLRCYAKAWKDYRCGHVVSRYAARAIVQFAASHLADSLEEAEDDQEAPSTRERAPIDTSWMSLAAVHSILRRTASVETSKLDSEEQGKASKFAHQVEAAKEISEKLWSVPEEHASSRGSFNKQGSIACQESEKPMGKDSGKARENSGSAKMDASLCYKAFKKKKADEWLHSLQAAHNEKKPSAEQLLCIQAVVQRCVQEARDELNNVEYRSEPLRLILHGVPGECFYSPRYLYLISPITSYRHIGIYVCLLSILFLVSSNQLLAIVLGMVSAFSFAIGTELCIYTIRSEDFSKQMRLHKYLLVCFSIFSWKLALNF